MQQDEVSETEVGEAVYQPVHQYLTRKEAAQRSGYHQDTLRNDDREGKYPNRRVRDDGTVEYAVADLVVAGRLKPDFGATPFAGDARSPNELATLRDELVQTKQRLEAADERIAEQRADIIFLRELVSQLSQKVA